jgi:hypothetical protein
MKVFFCLPGKSFTGHFLESWSKTLQYCFLNGIEVVMRRKYSSDIYQCRNDCLLAGNPKPWAEMRPFDGADYDYIMWIDSDMVWEPRDIVRLLSHDVDIVSGVAPIGTDMRAALGNFGHDEDGLPCLQYVYAPNVDKVPVDDKGLFEVHYAGGAFLCVKHSVYERMGYPWFAMRYAEHDGKMLTTSEDVGWCIGARLAGHRIMVDPKVKVGHEKSVIVRAGE